MQFKNMGGVCSMSLVTENITDYQYSVIFVLKSNYFFQFPPRFKYSHRGLNIPTGV